MIVEAPHLTKQVVLWDLDSCGIYLLFVFLFDKSIVLILNINVMSNRGKTVISCTSLYINNILCVRVDLSNPKHLHHKQHGIKLNHTLDFCWELYGKRSAHKASFQVEKPPSQSLPPTSRVSLYSWRRVQSPLVFAFQLCWIWFYCYFGPTRYFRCLSCH